MNLFTELRRPAVFAVMAAVVAGGTVWLLLRADAPGARERQRQPGLYSPGEQPRGDDKSGRRPAPAAPSEKNPGPDLRVMSPADALAYLAGLEPIAENERIVIDYLEHLASAGDWQSLHLAVAVIPERDGLLGGIKKAAIIWSGKDIRGLAGWARSFSSPKMIRQAGSGISSFVLNLPAEKKVDAINTLLQSGLAPEINARLYRAGIEELVSSDPGTAVRFALEIPDEEAGAADAMLMSKTGFGDAVNFLQSLYDRGSDKRAHAALLRFADHFAVHSPGATADWVSKIDDAAVREQALQITLASWGQKDAAAALAWVAGKAPPDKREALTGLIESLPPQQPPPGK